MPNLKEKYELMQKHDTLLARPMKHKITKKYDPNIFRRIFRRIRRPVTPDKNRRLDMLAEPVKFKRSSKWFYPEEPSTCVSRAVLEATCTARLDHLSRPFVRTLQAIRNERMHYGQHYTDMMNDRIVMSLDTIYYHNVKSLMQLEKQKRKGKKSSLIVIKDWAHCGDPERLLVLASAKKCFLLPPKKRVSLLKIPPAGPRVEKLAIMQPRNCYRTPSKDSLIFKWKIKEATLKCTPTERILELARVPARKLVEPWVPPKITKGVLTAVPTPRVLELSAPRARSQAVDSDFKEDAFEISKNAMKYKATPRILELAKPKER